VSENANDVQLLSPEGGMSVVRVFGYYGLRSVAINQRSIRRFSTLMHAHHVSGLPGSAHGSCCLQREMTCRHRNRTATLEQDDRNEQGLKPGSASSNPADGSDERQGQITPRKGKHR
jgi:hypothetical protein